MVSRLRPLPTLDSTVCTEGMRNPCAIPTHIRAATMAPELFAVPGVRIDAADQRRKEIDSMRSPPSF